MKLKWGWVPQSKVDQFDPVITVTPRQVLMCSVDDGATWKVVPTDPLPDTNSEAWLKAVEAAKLCAKKYARSVRHARMPEEKK